MDGGGGGPKGGIGGDGGNGGKKGGFGGGSDGEGEQGAGGCDGGGLDGGGGDSGGAIVETERALSKTSISWVATPRRLPMFMAPMMRASCCSLRVRVIKLCPHKCAERGRRIHTDT